MKEFMIDKFYMPLLVYEYSGVVWLDSWLLHSRVYGKQLEIECYWLIDHVTQKDKLLVTVEFMIEKMARQFEHLHFLMQWLCYSRKKIIHVSKLDVLVRRLLTHWY